MRQPGKIILMLWIGITRVLGQQPENPCAPFIRAYEVSHGIPCKLLTAIALVESGRKIGDTVVPWPWSINVKGKSYVFGSKKEAVRMVRKLRRKGITSIDVGCMQVNLKHHPKAFSSLEAAFDPATNIAYASRFLRTKKTDKGSWSNAIAHYHSSRPEFHLRYRKKVLQKWAKLRNAQMSLYIRANEEPSFSRVAHPKAVGCEGKIVKNIIAPSGRRLPITIQFKPYQGFNGDLPKISPFMVQEQQEIPGGFKIIRISPKGIRKGIPNSLPPVK